MDKLKKSCPFCGGQATINIEFENAGMDGSYLNWRIHCNKCGVLIVLPADNFYGRKSYTKEEAVDAWNKRVMPESTRILADVLDGAPLLNPCDKLWREGGWCKDHCKASEPGAECWLKYAEVMANE